MDEPHIRYNPLTEAWVLVSPHRMRRPWKGQLESGSDQELPEHDPANPLCPRSVRGNGLVNPDYTGTFAFDNDFPALLECSAITDTAARPMADASSPSLFRREAVSGKCRVICFHPKLNVTLPRMSQAEISRVIDVWIGEARQWGNLFDWVQIFENKGEIMGCSNPHPHCQVGCAT